ncbi:MAG: hypothetical protein ACYTG0_46255 [Planctomycetota bacterium]
MIQRSAFAWLVIAIVPAITWGAILSESSLTIDFTDSRDATRKAEWSDPELVTPTEEGLGWDGTPNSNRDAWIRTRPIGVGLSWRPLTRAHVSVTITPEARAVSQSNIEALGDVYVRFSPDLKNWSDWQALTSRPKPVGKPVKEGDPPRAVPMTRTYSGQIGVPRLAQEAYQKLLREYAKLDAPWKSDEEAAVRWILQRDPEFFKNHLPFVGHVQFLYETQLHGGRRLGRFEARLPWVVSGQHHEPRDQSLYKNRDDIPWRFQAD